MKKNTSELVAKSMKKVLNAALRTEANSASCVIMYQPETPKELAKFRKRK